MSIYSGFATRNQQQTYDHCVQSLLYVLQKRIIKFYQNTPADQDKFISLVLKLSSQLRHMEKNKYLQPKSSHSIDQLVKFMKVYHENSVQQPSQYTKQVQSFPSKDSKQNLPQLTIQKKKSSFWVQKIDIDKKQEDIYDLNKKVSQQQKQVIGINQNDSISRPQSKKFRKTSYYMPLFMQKNMSKKQSIDTTQQIKKTRVGSTGGVILKNKPPNIRAKITYHNVDSRSNISKRKQKSISRIGIQPDIRNNQVSDIIREYILKAKKQFKSNRQNS